MPSGPVAYTETLTTSSSLELPELSALEPERPGFPPASYYPHVLAADITLAFARSAFFSALLRASAAALSALLALSLAPESYLEETTSAAAPMKSPVFRLAIALSR